MRNPILRPGTRLKKYAHRVLILENLSGFQRMILPVEAVLLALLNGECSKGEITEAIGGFLGLNAEKAAAFVDRTLEKCAPCIDVDGMGEYPLRYEPDDFLYEVDLNAKPPRRFETPSEMLLSLTHKCNFRCVYCFNSSADCFDNELSTGEWLDIVRQMDELGVVRAIVSGGEPTLHPGCMAILRELKRCGILINFCTNGSMITDELLELLQGESIQVSLDAGDRETFKTLTGGIDAYDKVLVNMRRVTKRGIQLNVKAVMTSINLGSVRALYDACAACGVTGVTLAKFERSSGGREDNEAQDKLALSKEQKADLQAQLNKAKNANPSTMRSGTGLSRDVWRKSEDIVPCGAFTRAMIVQPDGNISCCERMPDVPEMLFGNVRDNTLLELWEHHRIAEFFQKRDETTDPTCGKCAQLHRCQTGCFAIKYFRGMRGDELYLRDPRCNIVWE